MLNSGEPFKLDLAKHNLPFGETRTQLASQVSYDFVKEKIYSQIGLTHWYVVENDDTSSSEIDEQVTN